MTFTTPIDNFQNMTEASLTARLTKSSVQTFAGCLLVISLILFGCKDTSFLVVAYNIRHGEGMDNQIDLNRTAAVISRLNPDVVLLQEVDRGAGRTGGIDQARALGELTGMHSAFGKFMDYDGGEYGMAALSRFPIRAFRNYELPPGPEPRSVLAARIEIGAGQEIVFVGVHLYRSAEERYAQAKKIVELFNGERSPVILAGDFNSTPDSEVIGLLRQYWFVPEKGKDRLTFPSDTARIEIDYVMIRPEGRFEIVESRVVDEPLASDHRPVLLEVRIK